MFHFCLRSSTRWTRASVSDACQSGINSAVIGSSSGRMTRPSFTGMPISRRSRVSAMKMFDRVFSTAPGRRSTGREPVTHRPRRFRRRFRRGSWRSASRQRRIAGRDGRIEIAIRKIQIPVESWTSRTRLRILTWKSAIEMSLLMRAITTPCVTPDRPPKLCVIGPAMRVYSVPAPATTADDTSPGAARNNSMETTGRGIGPLVVDGMAELNLAAVGEGLLKPGEEVAGLGRQRRTRAQTAAEERIVLHLFVASPGHVGRELGIEGRQCRLDAAAAEQHAAVVDGRIINGRRVLFHWRELSCLGEERRRPFG